jgi:hypothetical protein
MPALNEHEETWYVWPLGDILEALEKGETLAAGSPLTEGISPASIITERTDGTKSLRVQPAFAEGKPAAYVTTDVWLDIPKVWLQPAYREIDQWSAESTVIPNSPILIDVEEESLFYSPFWNFHLAVVGPGSNPERYRSTRQILDARPSLPLHPGGWGDYPICPVDFLATPSGTHLVDPTWGFDLAEIAPRYARYNGEQKRLLDLGAGTFDVDEAGLIEALPFFVFARRNAEGRLIAIVKGTEPEPRVAGVGPLWSGRPATITQNSAGSDAPRLGMFWNLVLAALPTGADAFHVSNHMGATAIATEAGIDIREFEGRVALNASCFDDPLFPTSCFWLDSQARIEGALGSGGIVVTKVNVNSVFVSIDKTPVPL